MRTNLLAGMAVIGVLCAGGAATGNAVSSGSLAAPKSSCPDGAASARLAKGATVQDPNSVSASVAARMDAQLQAKITARGGVQPATLPPGSININTYVHVITMDDGTGGPTQDMIRRQMNVLNKAYAGQSSKHDAATPFVFTLKEVDYTANSDWYDWAYPGTDPSDDHQAKKALHKGTYQDLNIYIANLGEGLLGYATFPGHKLVRDGLVMLIDSMPGGDAAPYNKGDTATHEIGHWLGLYHTFQGGCSKPGDRVFDTPYQDDGDTIFDCMKSQDTCPESDGVDPIHNFMNYSDDLCMDRFTAGQAARMSDTWVIYRQGQ